MTMQQTKNSHTIGALVIGQAPRPDLVDPLQAMFPHADIIQVGALDQLTAVDLPPHNATYPLITRMRTGETVMVEERFLLSKLQHGIHQLETAEPDSILLLCAGTFSSLHSTRPLIKPFTVGQATCQAEGWESLGFITPVAEQIEPIRERWQTAGFRPTVWAASLAQQDGAFTADLLTKIETDQLQAIVLDYVGHPREQVAQLQAHSPIPVLDLGHLAMKTVATYLPD